VPPAMGESGVTGSDSILIAKHRDRLFWVWGDTNLPDYPLGIFTASAAQTPLDPLKKFEPPLALEYDYFRNDKGRPRGVAPIPGKGPTWLTGMIGLDDKSGKPHLVATYLKVKAPLEIYETGLCVFNEENGEFQPQQVVWTKADGPEALIPQGHPFAWTDPAGKPWILFGDPFPAMKCAPSFEAWSDPKSWEKVTSPKQLKSPDGSPVEVHRGSVCWNAFRKKWMTIFTQKFGRPSAFGEIWYAEADSPLGPWGTAVKVLSHRNYTFYNPRIDHELTTESASFIVFEGTYTTGFANHAAPTPLYNYNQILYRLDLDDPKLAPAQK